MSSRARLSHFGLALLTVTVAAVARTALDPIFGARLPLITFYPAIILSAWFGGLWPGIVATVLSMGVTIFLWIQPLGTWTLSSTADVLALTLFGGVGAMISVLNETFHRGRAAERTAREHAEQARGDALRLADTIRTAERRVSDIVDGVPGVVWEAWGEPDASRQRIDFVSPYVETMLGYTTEEWLATPNFWLSIVHPDDREHAAATATRAFLNGEAHVNQFRWMAKDGRAIWVESHATVLQDASGAPVGMRGVTFDISVRRHIEEALRQSLDDVTRMQRVSTRLLRAGEFSSLLQDILEAGVDLTGADMGTIQLLDGDVVRIAAQRGFSDPFLTFFAKMRLPDAMPDGVAFERRERVVVEDVTTSPFFADSPALQVLQSAHVRALISTPLVSRSGRVVGVFSTHYRQARPRPGERALRMLDIFARQAADVIEQRGGEEARTLLANIVGSSDDAIISKDLDGTITSWNSGAERMFGYTAEEAIGQPITLIIPSDRLTEEAEILGRLRAGDKVEHFETERMTKDGRRLAISLTISPMRNEDGTVIGASKIARDITERVRAEEERTRLLEREQQARAAAEAASRAKDVFLATVSHELRTPLNAILGWATILEGTAPGEARVGKGLQSIHRNTRALAQLVDDLLDMSRLASGKMRLDVAPLDLGDVVEAAVESVLPASSAKDIVIDVTLDPSARTIVGDPTRLQQAIWNLLSNAVKFTPAGGHIEVSTTADQGYVELAVQDSGVGIAADFLPHVFDPFRQADASSTRSYGGLGLGLTIVRHLVELHGGQVRAESEGPRTGARFVLRFPRRHLVGTTRDARRAVDMPPAFPNGDDHRLDGLRVLIVDDDRESCEVMAVALRSHGAAVRTSSSAAEGIEILHAFEPHLVLSDIAMPERDGFAVLREVRAFEQTSGHRIPVAAVTAYARDADRDRAMSAGFDEYLLKPVEMSSLVAVVATLATSAG